MSAPEQEPLPLVVSFTDDPRVVAEAATEDYTMHVVPHSWRASKKSLSMSWYSLVSGMFYLVTAATLAAVVGTVDTLIGIVLACAVYGFLGYVTSKYATETGLTVALVSQRLFGANGSIVAPLILAATAMYYAVFESSMIAHAFHAYFGVLDIRIWYAIAVAMNLPLVIGGIRRWMDKYNAVLLPIYWLGLILVVFLARQKVDTAGWLTHMPASTPELTAPGWLYAFFVYLGVLVLIMFTLDFARFGKVEDVKVNGTNTFGPVFYVFCYLANGLLGIYIAYAAGLSGSVSAETIVEFIIMLMGGWGLLLVWVTQARINTANFYVASTNMEDLWTKLFRRKISRVGSVLICGAIIYVFMLTDVLSYLLVALAWQGAFIASWVAILLVHVILDKDKLTEFRPGRLASFSAGAWIWIGSSLLGVLFYQFGGVAGVEWSTPLTFAVSGILFAATYRSQRRKLLLQRGGDPRDEVDNAWEARVKCHVCDHSYIAVEMDRDPSVAGSPAICVSCASINGDYRKACLAEHERNVATGVAGARLGEGSALA
ncbi:purine-cytosine permease family protein [Steroidobacter cummioxidans]|uniref:purine-cytosine permease family protein n=1 Tax=Steroidobacter cummioxidans TaxID=1803913 RepID=UPI000E31AEC9|nr:thiamine permease [Steroidobacter cummioxidans]